LKYPKFVDEASIEATHGRPRSVANANPQHERLDAATRKRNSFFAKHYLDKKSKQQNPNSANKRMKKLNGTSAAW